ncbi:MAG: type II secretion system F family protein [Phycisphaerales bacterium]|nr:type II secretion system F family protein [Phycisphaerales bacterium]
MARFEYHARTAGGSPASGTMTAASRSEVVRLLAQRGETATKVVMATGGRDVPRSPRGASQTRVAVTRGGGGGRAMSGLELASFVREMSTAVEAGLPLLKALQSIAHQPRSARQKAMLDHLITGVESGQSLADAAGSWGKPFTQMTVSVIHAGEVSGRFAEVTSQLADLLDRDIELRRSILSATLYPLIVLGVVIAAVVIVVTLIVPPILTAVAGEVSSLPLPTRIVEAFASVMASYWLYILVALLGVVLGAKHLLSLPGPRLKFDRALLHTPILGRLLREVAVARFTRLLGTLIGAGLPILDSLRITRDTLGNMELARVIDDVQDQIAHGHSIAVPLERSGYFPSLLVQIVDLGERSGRLESMLLRAADSFDRRTQSAIKLFTAVLPPVMILILAAIVGFVLAAILLPLIELQSALG